MGGSVLQVRGEIDQVRIDTLHAAEIWGLNELAELCQHKLEPVFPIFLLRLDGKPIAFYYATPHVCIRPTVHPDAMTPREFYEVAKVTIATTRRFGNPLWLVHDKSVLASPRILSKLGLVEQDLKVFEVT